MFIIPQSKFIMRLFLKFFKEYISYLRMRYFFSCNKLDPFISFEFYV